MSGLDVSSQRLRFDDDIAVLAHDEIKLVLRRTQPKKSHVLPPKLHAAASRHRRRRLLLFLLGPCELERKRLIIKSLKA